jgi:hypothetical protein
MVLWICGFETALFGLTGAVFCTSPLLIYISGDLGNGKNINIKLICGKCVKGLGQFLGGFEGNILFNFYAFFSNLGSGNSGRSSSGIQSLFGDNFAQFGRNIIPRFPFFTFSNFIS